MRRREIVLLCFVIVSRFNVLLASWQGRSYEINICSEEQKFRCDDGELISLVGVTCGTRNWCSSSVNKTLFDLCHGQQTCSSLDLNSLFVSVCGMDANLGETSLNVKFKCVPGSTGSCRSNICADTSPGLSCPSGTFVHIRDISCGFPSRSCSRSVYTNLFLCEGVSRCAASGLKTMLSQNCQHEVPENRSVTVQYFCLPEHQIDSKCTTSKFRNLDQEFGILKSPHFDPASRLSTVACKWMINPAKHNKVKVTVHLVNTRITRSECAPDVLNITYSDCSSDSVVTRSFCIVDNASVEILSCGQVRILSLVHQGEESSDKFIISYQRYHSDVSSTVPSSLPNCLIPPAVIPTKEPPLPKTSPQPVARIQPVLKTGEKPNSRTSGTPNLPSSKTSSKSPASITRNFGPGDGIFEYRDSLFVEDLTDKDSNGGSSTLSRHLKLMILYIFFGVVILVLAVALIAVLISYYRISQLKDHKDTSSEEKAALCQQHEDTPLDTFQNHTLDESSGTLTSETTYTFRADRANDQVVATVHHDAIYEHDLFDPRLSNGSGISTFLAGKRDTDFKDLINTFQTGMFPLYSNIGESQSSEHFGVRQKGHYELAGSGHYDVPNDHGFSDIYEVIDQDNNNGGDHIHSFSHENCAHTNYDEDDDDGYHVKTNHTHSERNDGQNSPSNYLHYLINNDEYAIVCKSPKSSPNMREAESNHQHRLHENYTEADLNNDFYPAYGPFDNRVSANARWSQRDGEHREDEY